MVEYTYCDDDALRAERTRASSLTPNQFHKLCPGTHVKFGGSGGGDDDGGSYSAKYSAFGQPRCGDGSNFSFFFSRPLKQLTNDKKIIIEFQGGGACWDEDTCGMQQEYLAFPEYYDKFVGLSCSAIEYGAAVQGGNPLSMLCAKKVGNTDFTEYNTVVVPYCTQDVHLGDAPNVSYDGDTVVHHVGAHNMVRTLHWVFSNFPNPTHIFLTGCSAGGTAVPIAYDLVNKHYNKFGPRSVNINAIMDSSVYLTPSYFLQNGFPNWNPGTIMTKKLRFNYNKYQYQESYPDEVWNHVLKRGSNNDHWGFVTHSSDPVSLMFYQYMSGNGGDNRGRSLSLASPKLEEDSVASPIDRHLTSSIAGDHGRRTEDDLSSEWWTQISESMTSAKKKHHNVDTYIIDGEGHCSFGLYYPLQVEGFEEWASPILREGTVIGNRRPSVAAFLTSFAFGGILVLLTRRMKREREKGSLMNSSETTATMARRVQLGACAKKIQDVASPVLTKCQSWPWTAGYLLTTSIYFLSMLILQGFTHPLENLALGPSAVGLSTFGINNPALVIYRMEHFRLITSSFLCSGVITCLLMTLGLYKAGLEAAMIDNNHSHWHFPLVAVLLSFGINLIYSCAGAMASCSSLALLVGMNAFSSVMAWRSKNSYPSPLCFTIAVLILGCTPLFPFDSVVALIAAIVIGAVTGMALFEELPETASGPDDVYQNESTISREATKQPTKRIRWIFVQGMAAIYFMMYILLLLHVPSPNKQNVNPYLTGCNFVYSDQIGDFVNAYTNDGGRALEGNGEGGFDGENMCAQICLPHLAYRPVLWGAKQFALVALEPGTCEANGYDEHIADHTIREFTVVFEVRLFTSNGDSDD